MSDVRSDVSDPDRGGADDDRLPWLEAVEEEDPGPSPLKLIASVVIGLLVIGLIVGGLFWIGNRSAGGGNGEIIASPGEYKVRPSDPGGMQLDNESSTQVATSTGTEPQAQLNQAAAPEAPVTQPPQPQPQQPAAAQQQPPQQQAPQQAQARPQAPAPAQGAQQARLSGPTIQVGAYPSEAVANAEWSRLAQRFPYLANLQHAVIVYQRGNQTFYRLRAAGPQASDVCRRLREARQPCMDVN